MKPTTESFPNTQYLVGKPTTESILKYPVFRCETTESFPNTQYLGVKLTTVSILKYPAFRCETTESFSNTQYLGVKLTTVSILKSPLSQIKSNHKLQGWPKTPVVGRSFKSSPFPGFSVRPYVL